jgi:endonuclease/exonuclease/phosphatase family metal-dependent hydrolase
MQLRALTWNLFHGRDAPPDRALHTLRSRLLRVTEQNATHLQVNRDLRREFEAILCGAQWDVALLQECPPRWAAPIGNACAADRHVVLTSRNQLGRLRALAARLNPDLIASNEGGCNLTLARRATIAERRELVLRLGPRPERRMMAFSRLARGDGEVCIANLHASAGASLRQAAEEELLQAAGAAVEWAGEAPLLFGGDLNVRPRDSAVYSELERRFSLRAPTADDALDHLLTRGLVVIDPPAPWSAQAREISLGGLAIRLSDHAPVDALFAA